MRCTTCGSPFSSGVCRAGCSYFAVLILPPSRWHHKDTNHIQFLVLHTKSRLRNCSLQLFCFHLLPWRRTAPMLWPLDCLCNTASSNKQTNQQSKPIEQPTNQQTNKKQKTNNNKQKQNPTTFFFTELRTSFVLGNTECETKALPAPAYRKIRYFYFSFCSSE